MTPLAEPYRLPVNPPGHRNPGWWVMVLVIATEAMLFVYLLFSYVYLASIATTRWPPPGPPELTLAAPNTVLLLASSGTLVWAERQLRRDARRRFHLGLIGTVALGAIFLSIQGVEYARLAFTPATDAYGSLFYTITGLHAAHVTVGLLFLLVVLVRAWLGHFGEGRHLAVTNAAMYWHFVDIVWVFVFTTLYLSPHLG